VNIDIGIDAGKQHEITAWLSRAPAAWMRRGLIEWARPWSHEAPDL